MITHQPCHPSMLLNLAHTQKFFYIDQRLRQATTVHTLPPKRSTPKKDQHSGRTAPVPRSIYMYTITRDQEPKRGSRVVVVVVIVDDFHHLPDPEAL